MFNKKSLSVALLILAAACSNVSLVPTNTPPPPPTAVAAPTDFRPVAVGQGPCVGVADPENVTLPERRTTFSAPENQNIDTNKVYCAIMTTEKGRIVIQLYPEITPLHVNSFVFLARQGFYDGLTFHRVIPDFVAQGGDPDGTGGGGPGYTVPLEVSPLLRYDRVGVLGMARTADPNSAGSQFFITLAPLPNLEQEAQPPGYTIFGQVVEGMEFVNQITPRDPQAASTPGDKIVSIRIVEKAK